MKNLSIIIPTFNDQNIIKDKISFLFKFMKKIKVNYEVILINDGSTDNTKFLIKDFLKKKNFYILNNKYNKGKSYSIRRGLKKSKYNHVILIDSDLPYFSKFRTVIKLLKKKNDFVFINRRHKKSKIIKKDLNLYVLFRFIVGYMISLLLKITIKLDTKNIDTQAGLKGFKKIKGFNNHKFISSKFFLDIELIYLYSKLSKKIISLPVSYNISKSSTINIFNLKKNFQLLFELYKVIISITSEKKLS